MFKNNLVKKKYYIVICIFIFVFFLNKTFLYSYFIINNNYKNRMVKVGGYCNGYGYGFVDHVQNKFSFLENFSVKNYGDYPSIESYFYNYKKINSDKFIFLINITENILLENYLKKNYLIIEKNDNCYLVKKND